MTPKRLLIVNADDFGLTPEVNRAIVEAAASGIVRSASLLPGGEYAEDAARLALSCPEMTVGVHLALTQLRPIRVVRRHSGPAKNDGRFPQGPGELVNDLFWGRIRFGDIVEEFSAQVERVFDLGFSPTHLDSHQHVHLLPVVRAAFARVARDYGIRQIRMPSLGGPARSKKGWVKAASIAAAARSAQPLFRDFLSPDRCWGLACTGDLNRNRLLEIVAALTPGTHELICHPSLSNDTAPEATRRDYHGSAELAALCDSEVRERIAANTITLGTFADLPGAHIPRGMHR